MPRKVFSAGETLLASDVNTYLADQSVMVFDDAAARTSAIPSPIEGMVTYVKDLDLVQVWDGSEWDEVSGGGSITVSSTAPGDPEEGDLWFDDVSGSTFVYYTDSDSSQWVEVGAGSGPTAAAVSSSAPASAEQGQLWFDSESGNLYFYYVDVDGGQWVQVRSAAPAGLTNVGVSNPVAGEKLVYDGTEWVNLEAYAFVDTVYFTSNGTFSKGDYPWLRAIRVKCQGAGGGGGGLQATDPGEAGFCSGGGGGAYSESFITDIVGLDSSVTVTRGAGGTGSDSTGGVGGTSSFGSLVTANGGAGGASFQSTKSFGSYSNQGAFAGSVGAGDIIFSGSGGDVGAANSASSGRQRGGSGGSSHLGGGAHATRANATPASGLLYGGGGAGAALGENQSSTNGGNGANGIVIVELYA